MGKEPTSDFSNDAVMRAATNSTDFDFVSESPLSRITENPQNYGQLNPKDVSFSFKEVPRRSNAETDEVLLCSSNNSFRRKSSFMRTKTQKSRLLDPPDENCRKSETQRMVKSQVFSKGASELDEDDPFLDEDFPDEFNRMKFSVLSILQLLSLILIIAGLVCSLTFDVLKRRTIFQLELWKWEVMVLVLISGRLVSGWGIRVLVFFVERNFMLRKRVLYFVYGLRNAVQNCIWLGLVLVAWQCIFDKRVERATNGKILPNVTRIWVCLLVGTLIWLLKTMLVKVLASSFHVSAFFDRIQESLFNQYVIETLSGPPLVEIQNEKEEEERVIAEVQELQSAGATVPPDLKANMFPKSGRIIGTPRKSTVSAGVKSPMSSKNKDENGINIDHLHRLNQKNISAWNMKRLMNIVRHGVISTLHDEIQHATGEDEEVVQITSECQAKVAAKKIFVNVAKPGARRIYEEDLMRFMREDEVSKTIRLFEGGNDRKGISKRALKDWVKSNLERKKYSAAIAVNRASHLLKKGELGPKTCD